MNILLSKPKQIKTKRSIELIRYPRCSLSTNKINFDFRQINKEEDKLNFNISKESIKQYQDLLEENGVFQVDNFIDNSTASIYANLYAKFLSNEIDASSHRHDLGSFKEQKEKGDMKENVCQIMWPSLFIDTLVDGPLHLKTKYLSKMLLGQDMDFDFDMLIYKAAGSDTAFPWHQDEGYWTKSGKLHFTDLRGLTFWIALDDTTVEDGCLWFVPGSHKKGLFRHKEVKEGHHTIEVQGAEELIKENGRPYPIKKGGCLVSNGRILHYSTPNSSNNERKAFIINYRPTSVIAYMRDNGFDHGKKGLMSLKITK